MRLIKAGVEIFDENTLRESNRFLFVTGEPGSGKSEMLVHAAARCCCRWLLCALALSYGYACPRVSGSFARI